MKSRDLEEVGFDYLSATTGNDNLAERVSIASNSSGNTTESDKVSLRVYLQRREELAHFLVDLCVCVWWHMHTNIHTDRHQVNCPLILVRVVVYIKSCFTRCI